ncbi:hypothetical protein GCM10009001_00140 [Virgibacillus siamensis]|uniref:Hydrolase n=1 Tax=Virgibacillus siamensis TaxID=480071 RepID=A0ABP3QG76_9BACI
MERKKYYVNMASQEISRIEYGNNADFVIYATWEEAQMLRAKLDRMNDADFNGFFRAHVPIRPYHHDQANDDYDEGITDAFRMIYDLGNEATKEHIVNMGVLSENHM